MSARCDAAGRAPWTRRLLGCISPCAARTPASETEKFHSDRHGKQNTLRESPDSGPNSRTDALLQSCCIKLTTCRKGRMAVLRLLTLSALAASAALFVLPEAMFQRSSHLVCSRSRKGMTFSLSILPIAVRHCSIGVVVGKNTTASAALNVRHTLCHDFDLATD
jgi:hypothetical protein